MANIKIEYDGAYPNLCSGHLFVTVDGVRWDFGGCCLSSGGYVSFDDDWNEDIGEGPWSVSEWPDKFPEQSKDAVTEAINNCIPWGCCGGCV